MLESRNPRCYDTRSPERMTVSPVHTDLNKLATILEELLVQRFLALGRVAGALRGKHGNGPW